MRIQIFVAVLAFAFVSCSAEASDEHGAVEGFADYWNQGKAELTSYQLEQARYGEIHQGHAVLVFVTEPFSKSKQVKLDNPGVAGGDHAQVLKLNFTRKFNTGIYPYSMMQSVFSPTAGGSPLKVSTSSQEWCGHTFLQLNRRGERFDAKSFSYFESEGDQAADIDRVLLEDELWNRIRINPKSLPTGRRDVLPSTTYLRLAHKPLAAQSAQLTLTANGARTLYEVNFEQLGRKLTIEFDNAFPHTIHGWTETYQSGWGATAKVLTTKATRNKQVMEPYWEQHSNADRAMRAKLGLPVH